MLKVIGYISKETTLTLKHLSPFADEAALKGKSYLIEGVKSFHKE